MTNSSQTRATPRRSLKYKILRDHGTGCRAVELVRKREWGTPWAYLNQVEYRDSAGRLRKSGGKRWWLVGCNSMGCPGLATIEETSILEGLPRE